MKLIQFYLLLSTLINCQSNDIPQIDIVHKLPINDIYEILLLLLIGFVAGLLVMACCCWCCPCRNTRNNTTNDYSAIL